MTRPNSSHAYSIVLLATVLVVLPSWAVAQENATPPAPEPELETVLTVRMQVGDATHNLLALQREGTQASNTPRPLAGDVASLSYQRYLDSFKLPIPEKFNTAVQRPSGGGSR
ncbi:DUF3613 domain-containing protein [Variovorax sp. UMC13]|uniref:DUF3613 domain-containing protein n=1 Tax=Variovorax sp. UMC13 TaxID=1862326 RepID=UPI00160002C1|nr:DUF3613 domain-containing protein [Variovorax sp. UMC13]MBB1599337.1 hypothetical protein [Variovorax sp. UMC13]